MSAVPPATLRSLIDLSPDLALVAETDSGRIIDCNEMAVEALGYPREHLTSMRLWGIDASLTREQYAAWTAANRERRDQLGCHAVYRRRDGSTFAASVRLQLILAEEGLITLLLARPSSDAE